MCEREKREERRERALRDCFSFSFFFFLKSVTLSVFNVLFLFWRRGLFSMVDVDDTDAAAAAAASASQRVVVLDNGGCSIKLGFAGDAHPM